MTSLSGMRVEPAPMSAGRNRCQDDIEKSVVSDARSRFKARPM